MEYLETDATPYEIRDYLSLCGPSIESVTKVQNDYVYDIEVISNRIDYASVLGIAQEAVAILPMFGKKAKLKIDPIKIYKINSLSFGNNLSLFIDIKNKKLCSRFSAVVFDNIKISKSPEYISQRLIDSGIKSINNVVDISNYLMLTLGQPVHVFDYDQIKKNTMIMRESKKGEKIITLDENEIILPGGDIVIEDGDGKLIDLCGIMGGLNSSVTDKTKRVVLFVQTYNKEIIRKTTMTTGVRTVAATYFEKGLDEERVESTIVYGSKLLEKFAEGKINSQLYDIYPNPYKTKVIKVDLNIFDKSIGIKIDSKKIVKILNDLNFAVEEKVDSIEVKVPSYREYDVNIPEDLVEEVARIYGYHNIPSKLQLPAYVEQPKDMEDLFVFQNKIKIFLKHLGLNEIINYSMISKELIEEFGYKTKDHLRLANSISEDIEYLRTSLLPSLFKNIKDNKGKKENMRFFEVAKVYLPKKNNLPDEVYKLGIVTNSDYFDLKGIIEALFKELNIIEDNNDIAWSIIEKAGIYMTEIDLKLLIQNYKQVPKFQSINPYAVIKLDKTFTLTNKYNYQIIKNKAFESKILQKIEVISLFENKLTLRFYYSSFSRNITEKEALSELDHLLSN